MVIFLFFFNLDPESNICVPSSENEFFCEMQIRRDVKDLYEKLAAIIQFTEMRMQMLEELKGGEDDSEKEYF